MKVLLVGSASGTTDEGMTKVLSLHARNLSLWAEMRTSTPAGLLRSAAELRHWSPDVVHYMAGPTTVGLAAVLVAATFIDRAAVVVSMIHPAHGFIGRLLLRSHRIAAILDGAAGGQNTERGHRAVVFSESGAAFDTFRPASSAEEKSAVRAALDLPVHEPIVLHVGHVKEGRNLRPLAELTKHGYQVVVIGSSRTRVEPAVHDALVGAGCRVITAFQPNIAQWYQAADCYVFPTVSEAHAIRLPLSVLEAMATDLPVVSSSFGAIPKLLGTAPRLALVDPVDAASLARGIKDVLNRDGSNREFAAHFDWSVRSHELFGIYRDCTARRS